MSWPQRPGGAAPAQLQRQPQGYNNQQNMYPNYQSAPPPAGVAQQQQCWPAQQPQYNQQYGHAYQQQDYGTNANQFYQQSQYNQNYQTQPNQGYGNMQQQYPQNYYPNQAIQPQGYQPQPNADSWEDNWDWGWDESTKQAKQGGGQNPATLQTPHPPQQQNVYNNANVIEESFASTDTWNWSMEDKKDSNQAKMVSNSEPAALQPEAPAESSSNSASEPPIQHAVTGNLSSHAPTEEVKTLSDREVVKERLPNLALGKRFHLDNLTPQWSIESQMSQESSDGPQTHSEGTYRSDNQSRNSSKSSPGINTESSNFNYSQSALDEFPPTREWARPSNEDTINTDTSLSRHESHNEITNSLQEMSIANRENPAPEPSHANKDVASAPPCESPINLPPPVSTYVPPPTSQPIQSMPPAPPVTSIGLPLPPLSSGVLLPPSNFSQTSSSTNPFKQSGTFSHKKGSPSIPFPPTSSTNLSSPNVVSKVSQHRVPLGFGANLETTPDNSERPDQPHISSFRPIPVAQQVPDNLEVAPQNDRNEYLQTAHLSSSDYGENTDFSRNAPPPGLRRMVVGQQESEYNQTLNISGDEPPPGLARMVPGQQTEVDNTYNQPDNYMERHIDGQPTDNGGRPYRQADGQQTTDNYVQPSSRGAERRPIGLDRMVPGEPSNDEYPQYQAGNYAASEQRVVTGVDHDYPLPTDAGPTDIREQNVDGSDYSEPTPRNTQRNVIGARELSNDVTQDFSPIPDEQQREITMEGENLQDLSAISSVDMSFSREQPLDGADVNVTDAGTDRKTDLSDSIEHAATSSRRQSLNRVNTSGEESERDRAFKSSPRRDKHKSSRDRDRDRDRDKDGRYPRGDRKHDRDRDGDKRSQREKDRGDRERDGDWDRDESPHSRRHRRSTRSRRYDTEDTDYYSDRERDRRSYREGSYASKPPRPDDKDRRFERDRDRSRRFNTVERSRRLDDERSPRRRERRDERERYEARYRDIDPTRKHGNLRAQRDDDERRRGDVYSSASREAAAVTDEDAGAGPRRRERWERRERRDRDRDRDRDPYYDKYAGGAYPDAYELQRQQYQYYEQLRLSDPHAYLQVYKQLLAGRAPLAAHVPAKHAYAHAHVYGTGYEPRAEDRGSVHSGRSSTNGLKGNDTYYCSAALRPDTSCAPSMRTDLSDRELNTDASLNLHLEESTVRSERMTPFKFSTAHIKGSIGSRHVVVVRPSYPVDGLPATVQIVSLGAATARDPAALELAAYPGPLLKGVTHKKSVIEYCATRVRNASRAAPRDVIGYVLVWELLALLLRQNGVVVGADIAELLMKNKKEYEYKVTSAKSSTHNESRRGSSLSIAGREEERAWSPDQPSASISDLTPQEELSSLGPAPAPDERTALDRLREYLTYGNRQEALEWAMSCGLWGHAMQLAGSLDRRARAHVAARFLQAVPRADPLHTLYAHLQAQQPPAATCVTDERWGDWRPHAAIMLSNSSAKPEQDQRTLLQLGDSLLQRGLLYSAQFCYVSAGAELGRHPLAPLQGSPPPPAAPRLALLLADPRAHSLATLATNQAIFATEIYEYALSLNRDYVVNELQVYKLILATRLVDCGQYSRALGYVEACARGLRASPRAHCGALAGAAAELAERLQHAEPALPPAHDDSAEPSPRHHHWLHDVKQLAHMLTAEESQHTTPQHQNYYAAPAHPAWGEQVQAQQQQYQPILNQTYTEQPDESVDYTQYYQQQQTQQNQQQQQQDPLQQHQQDQEQQSVVQQQQQPTVASEPPPPEQYAQWPRADEPAQAQPYDSNYWHNDSLYSYSEAAGGAGGAEGGAGRPQITMPGGAAHHYGDHEDEHDQQDLDTQTPKAGQGKKGEKPKEDGKGGGAGGAGGAGGGWLGGILTKLSLRAPNQMILPDDKNPTIVWDAEHKRWRNLDADEDAAPAAPPPPPTRADLAPRLQATTSPAPPGPGAAAAPPISNIFKMQKGRHIKKSYVDVLNPGGAARALPPAAEVLGAPPPAPPAGPPPAPPAGPPAAPAYFVPAPLPASQPVHVSIPSTPGDTPQPSPTPSSSESDMYDPMQLETVDRLQTGL